MATRLSGSFAVGLLRCPQDINNDDSKLFAMQTFSVEFQPFPRISNVIMLKDILLLFPLKMKFPVPKISTFFETFSLSAYLKTSKNLRFLI